jgi:membrane-bound ClpP family serine protease
VTVRFARSRSGQALVLDDEISGSASPTDQLAPLIGCAAVVSATLRPSGVVTIDGSRYDAMVRDGGFVEAEALVVVVAQEHGQLVVERPSEHNA